MEFQVGDKVLCTISSYEDEDNPYGVREFAWGQVGTVVEVDCEDGAHKVSFDPDSQWVQSEGLQYIFQEGDIVEINHPDEDQAPWHLALGSRGVVTKVTEFTIWVEWDDRDYGPVGHSDNELDLVDRAPKSDAEQCCNADDEFAFAPSKPWSRGVFFPTDEPSEEPTSCEERPKLGLEVTFCNDHGTSEFFAYSIVKEVQYNSAKEKLAVYFKDGSVKVYLGGTFVAYELAAGIPFTEVIYGSN